MGDGWVEWDGGETPYVEVRLRNGTVHATCDLAMEDWEHREEDSEYDILAYRVVKA